MSSGKEIHEKVVQHMDKTDPGTDTGIDNWAKPEFKGKYFSRDDYDTVYQTKLDILSSGPPGRYMDVTDKEAKYFIDKAKQLELLNFHRFLQQHYQIDARDPVKMEWAQRMFPDFWRMREQLIDQNAEVQKRLAKMALLGPKDPDDFELLFAIKTGRVSVPEGPLYAPQEPVPNLKRGLFNPIGIGARARDGAFGNILSPLQLYGDADALNAARLARTAAPYDAGQWGYAAGVVGRAADVGAGVPEVPGLPGRGNIFSQAANVPAGPAQLPRFRFMQ